MPRWLKQVLSYIVSFVVYAAIMNWKVALVLMGGVAFHECGHLYAAKIVKMKTYGFYLIPFMGGMALVGGRYRKYSDLAFVAIAGPIAGLFLTLACLQVYLLTGWTLIGAAGAWMAWLNLFNLIPLAMLDGGQLAQSITYSIGERVGAWFLTISYLIAVFVLYHFNPVLLLLVIFIGVQQILHAWQRVDWINKGWGHMLPPQPDKMNWKGIGYTLLVYLLTGMVLLGAGSSFTHHGILLQDLFR